MKNFINLINFRLLLLHFLATWLISCASQIIVKMWFTDFLEEYHQAANKWDIIEKYNGFLFLLYLSIGALTGLLLSFSISLYIVIKQKWGWAHSVLLFWILFILILYDKTGAKYSEVIPNKFGYLSYLIINAALLITLALPIFFSGRINKFIALGSRLKS
ncbi:hypothetical protein [Flavobacterium subsaxonicum]|uniref:Lipoprotein n=1 Tax=Flavobacterium subsaxonicum WB 4.1-42 = DSM 21790 TaxID=1121898 RepID=A0A0A2MIL8_9FLAO|nr:hypothetical protein [Flavobacterium subsaxonicum]KGO92482.1 hypothetical protein Q766_11910 [Flavobacterium subsaxonicum WB 4.1-42 = DSM 21790]